MGASGFDCNCRPRTNEAHLRQNYARGTSSTDCTRRRGGPRRGSLPEPQRRGGIVALPWAQASPCGATEFVPTRISTIPVIAALGGVGGRTGTGKPHSGCCEAIAGRYGGSSGARGLAQGSHHDLRNANGHALGASASSVPVCPGRKMELKAKAVPPAAHDRWRRSSSSPATRRITHDSEIRVYPARARRDAQMRSPPHTANERSHSAGSEPEGAAARHQCRGRSATVTRPEGMTGRCSIRCRNLKLILGSEGKCIGS